MLVLKWVFAQECSAGSCGLLKWEHTVEEETFGYWTKHLSEKVKPDVMMCGHIHALEFYEKGGEYDAYGQPCDVVVGSLVKRN